MDILGNDTVILLMTTFGLVLTTVSIVLDTRDQRDRAASQRVRVEA